MLCQSIILNFTAPIKRFKLFTKNVAHYKCLMYSHLVFEIKTKNHVSADQ